MARLLPARLSRHARHARPRRLLHRPAPTLSAVPCRRGCRAGPERRRGVGPPAGKGVRTAQETAEDRAGRRPARPEALGPGLSMGPLAVDAPALGPGA